MKRLIIAVCMLVTGIAISIGGYVNLKSICRNMSCSVNEVIRAAENGDADETKRKCDDTEKMWDKKSPLLGVYTNHSEMDELMMLMKLLICLVRIKIRISINIVDKVINSKFNLLNGRFYYGNNFKQFT